MTGNSNPQWCCLRRTASRTTSFPSTFRRYMFVVRGAWRGGTGRASDADPERGSPLPGQKQWLAEEVVLHSGRRRRSRSPRAASVPTYGPLGGSLGFVSGPTGTGSRKCSVPSGGSFEWRSPSLQGSSSQSQPCLGRGCRRSGRTLRFDLRMASFLARSSASSCLRSSSISRRASSKRVSMRRCSR